MSTNWSDLISAKRQALDSKIPKEWRLSEKVLSSISETSDMDVCEIPETCGLLTEQELEITNSDGTSILCMLRDGEVKAVDVCTAFCKRAAIAQQTTNCLTEIMFDAALARAAELDEHYAATGKLVGPLHGLPISIKDSFNVPGVQTTIGYVSWLANPPATNPSALVTLLLRAGAVLHVKTNVPQTLMTADSHNNIFGRTLNPSRLCLSAGGSSGGEGACVAMRGSVLGVGTDIAGSIRIPALFNGLFGLRPSSNRVPYGGQASPVAPGNPGPIVPVAGPLTTALGDVKMFMHAIVSADNWDVDPSSLSVPWRTLENDDLQDNEQYWEQKKLRLGLLRDDASVPVQPCVRRMMAEAEERLRAAGHTIVPLDAAPELAPVMALAWKYFTLDPFNSVAENIRAAGEAPIPSVANRPQVDTVDYKPSLESLWGLKVEHETIRAQWHKLYVDHGLDAIVLPSAEGPVPRHDQFGSPAYTVLANVLDHPSLQMPFMENKPWVVEDTIPGKPGELAAGFQIMGKPRREEELIQVAQGISSALYYPRDFWDPVDEEEMEKV